MAGYYDTRLKTPFNCIVSGASKSGKTTLVKNLLTLSDSILTQKPDRVIVFYKYMQDIYNEMLETKLVHELISLDSNEFNFETIVEKINPYKNGNGSMIIFDDSMTEVADNFEQIFTNISHHHNCSVIFITQNLFYKDKAYRTMSLNTHYFFLMKNERDKQQIGNLARQFCPGNTTYVIQSFNDAAKAPYSYLLIDFTQDSPACLKLRSNIFPHQFPYQIYLEK
ncbi:ATPase/DNA packaging protein [Aeromonas sobria]|uniref:ATPase/DNA packaging protein n=1 Tax=Aeromonas sobria TaxID=646 RepID=UPI003F414708